MRKYINIVNEALRPTKTRTATDDLSSLMPDMETGGAIAPASPTGNAPATVDLKQAGGNRTRQAMGRANFPAGMGAAPGNLLRDLEAMGAGQDEISDEQARINAGMNAHGDAVITPVGVPEPTTPENLPAVISTAMMGHGDPDIDMTFDPEWHQVKHLPGYLQAGIRQIGRQVFRQFTNTPIEDIQMMCDILNPPRDVRQMAGWIVQNGVEQTDAVFDFAEHLPGYAAIAGNAECKLYNSMGYQFLIMRDNGGHYIYGWPEDDARIVNQGGGAAQLGGPSRQLPRY